MPPDRLDGLEDVYLPVLDDLLDAGVGRAVDAAPSDAVGRDDDHRAVVAALPPPLHHVHQLHQGVGRGRDLGKEEDDKDKKIREKNNTTLASINLCGFFIF